MIERSRRAQADRRVTLRPAPDTMAYLGALLPVAQAVAVHASLTAAADAARTAGDERGKGQVMADTLVTRATGQCAADAVPVEVQLVMTDRTLLAGDETPAQLSGYGTVPAAWARLLLLSPSPSAGTSTGSGTPGATDEVGRRAATVWLRRLYTHPATGALVAMDSTRRTFDGGLRAYLLTRDTATCRTPWCDAPARHLDHVTDHAHGGPTTVANGQSLCVRCNHTKQLPGWHATPAPDAVPDPVGGSSDRHARAPTVRTHRRHTVITTTPTGHRYSSTAPPLLPGHPPDPSTGSLYERWLQLVIAC